MKKIVTQQELQAIWEQSRPIISQGSPAKYIPALQSADPSKLGVCVALSNGTYLKAGDVQELFTIQSIVKIIIFARCLLDRGTATVSDRVNIEPSNEGFNEISSLETKSDKKPLNPMINAGAIACVSLLSGNSSQEKIDQILDLTRIMANRRDIYVNQEVYLSEKSTGARNRALGYYLQSTGIIPQNEPIEEILDTYFQACSIEINCIDLAHIALVLAHNGLNPLTKSECLPNDIARIIKATMFMCGMYNESGHVAINIGLPAKSGVGGGILSLIPNSMGIGIYGPSLNEFGNSVAGMALLENLSKSMDASLF